MQKPSAGLSDAENPIAITRGVEGVEIVAGFAAAVPPLAGDALGPANVIEPMHLAPIGEGYGLPIAALRGADDCRDGARLAQQSQWAEKMDRLLRDGNIIGDAAT
jgi:hypothetical protein